MPFGLCNAPATFTTLMHNIFHEYLDDFVIIYIDDILVYLKTAEEPAKHLEKVFQKLRSNKLYAKGNKCDWGKLRIKFLGHELTQGGVMVDDQKIKAILEWKKPKTTKGLRSFLRLASYYRKFVRDFAKIAKPLLDLLKKSVSEIWDEHCYRAFEELKRRLTFAHVLKFPEFKKPFEVHTDASDFAIRGVLMQEGRPVAFEIKKLSDFERRWPTHEKEMWAVVHCLKLWQHYLGLEYTKVYTDNVSVRYFEAQPKITPKQWRWADVLACFNVDLIHKPGRDNVVPDALSRRQELRIIFTGESSLMRKICEGYQDDEESKKILDTLRLGKKLEHFRLKRGVVWFKQKCMLVPKGKLRLDF